MIEFIKQVLILFYPAYPIPGQIWMLNGIGLVRVSKLNDQTVYFNSLSENFEEETDIHVFLNQASLRTPKNIQDLKMIEEYRPEKITEPLSFQKLQKGVESLCD